MVELHKNPLKTFKLNTEENRFVSKKSIRNKYIQKNVFFLQVMQFGRIDHNAYTLDFQYPFTAVQAFAVALANVTQRLK